MKYKDWIAANLPQDPNICMGKCPEYTEILVRQFPELQRVRGHVFWDFDEIDQIKYPDGYPHWWCVSPDGEIVDPTLPQFCLVTGLRYEAWDESRTEPTGKCPNCGKYCYDDNYCCCKSCEEEYLAYLNGDM